MESDPDVVVMVGAGDLGRSILEALVRLPEIEVRAVFDADPAAPGIALAREHGIECRTDGRFDELSGSPDVDLVIETSGDPGVLAALRAAKHPDTCLLTGAAARVIARLADSECRAAAVAADVNVEKARYVRQASHQIKSPLSTIQSYVNVILGGYTGEIPERTREVVEKIHSRIDAALRDLAKRRMLADLRCSGPDGLQMSLVPVSGLVGQAVERQSALASEHGIGISYLPLDYPDLVRCDQPKLVDLFSELLENAIIYSHDGGTVEVSVDREGEGLLTVAVRDHGIGIPARCLPHVFDEDYRADSAKKHHPDGAGVGLTIARTIADLHGLHVSVQSDEGQGSLFTVALVQAPTP